MKHAYEVTDDSISQPTTKVPTVSILRQPDGSYVNPLVEGDITIQNGRSRSELENIPMADSRLKTPSSVADPSNKVSSIPTSLPNEDQKSINRRPKRHVEIRNPPVCDCRYLPEPHVSFFNGECECCHRLKVKWKRWSPEKRRGCKLLCSASVFVVLVTCGFIFYAKRDKLVQLFLQPNEICQTPDCVIASGNILSSMDDSYSPCLDFYSFVCKGWQKTHPLPAYHQKLDSFIKTSDELLHSIKFLLEEPPTKVEPKLVSSLRNFYQACANDTRLQEVGVTPLLQTMSKYGGFPAIQDNWVDDKFDWINTLAELRRDLRMRTLVDIDAGVDAMNSSNMIIYINQGFISSSVYLAAKNDNYTRENFIQDFKDVVNYLSEQQRYNNAQENSKTNISFEPISLSTDSIPPVNYIPFTFKTSHMRRTRDVLRDAERVSRIKNVTSDAEDLWNFINQLANITDLNRNTKINRYNKMTIEELENLNNSTENNIDFLHLMKLLFKEVDITITRNTEVVVRDVIFFKNLAKIIAETPPQVIANIFMYNLVAPFGSDVQLSSFAGPMAKHFGRYDQRIWAECIPKASHFFDEALIHLHASKDFASATKKLKVVKNMLELMHQTLQFTIEESFSWMDAETRRNALEKAKEIKKLVGFPDYVLSLKYLDNQYPDFPEISNLDHFSNVMKLEKYFSLKLLKHINMIPNRDRWTINKIFTNAFYNFRLNSVQIPYGILQPPFLRAAGNVPSLTYGSLGSILGHELSHGFDNKGILRDGQGNLNSWATNDSVLVYHNMTECFVQQYQELPKDITNNGEPMKLDGQYILTEAIADNLGMDINWKTFKKNHKKEIRLIGLERYSADQLFFIAFGQNWCLNESEESHKNSLLNAVHPPNKLRITGVLQNSRDFAQVFNCHEVPNSPYVLPKKCSLLGKIIN